ncbi:MAG: divergent PAP2 family protein [Erysipelotrichaceae bacterium]
MSNTFIAISAISACLAAQILKPIWYYCLHQKWDFSLIGASGGMPSSHSSLVTSLTLAVGLSEGFNSSLFYISLFFSCIICFDAANVRYYAGQNISLTKKLIDDLKELHDLELPFKDPIYQKKMKEVLGHTYIEVLGGIILGVLVVFVCYIIMKGAY